jgi:hypothetical protein
MNCFYSQLQYSNWEWMYLDGRCSRFISLQRTGNTTSNSFECWLAVYFVWILRTVLLILVCLPSRVRRRLESSGCQGTVLFSWRSIVWRLFDGVPSIFWLVDIDYIRWPVTCRHQLFSVLVLGVIRKLPAEWCQFNNFIIYIYQLHRTNRCIVS